MGKSEAHSLRIIALTSCAASRKFCNLLEVLTLSLQHLADNKDYGIKRSVRSELEGITIPTLFLLGHKHSLQGMAIMVSLPQQYIRTLCTSQSIRKQE